MHVLCFLLHQIHQIAWLLWFCQKRQALKPREFCNFWFGVKAWEGRESSCFAVQVNLERSRGIGLHFVATILLHMQVIVVVSILFLFGFSFAEKGVRSLLVRQKSHGNDEILLCFRYRRWDCNLSHNSYFVQKQSYLKSNEV